MAMMAKRINLIMLLISVLLLALLLDRYYRLRTSYYLEYLRHKEIMLLLKNYQARQKATIDENFVRQKLSEVGADFLSFKQTEVGYEVKARNLKGEGIPRLVYALESAGVEIIKFKAVDNTGQGIYELEMVLR